MILDSEYDDKKIICAEDARMKPTFVKICEFVTVDVFLFSQIDKYSEQE